MTSVQQLSCAFAGLRKANISFYKYTMMYQSNTRKLCYVYYCIRAICFDSYRIIFRPFQDTDPYLAMFKIRCGIPNAYILDITMYKMHVSLCSYCTIRILISKTLGPTFYNNTTQIHTCNLLHKYRLKFYK